VEGGVDIHGDDGWLCSRMGVEVLGCVREVYVARRHDEEDARPMRDGHSKVGWTMGCSWPRRKKGTAVAWSAAVLHGLVRGVITA